MRTLCLPLLCVALCACADAQPPAEGAEVTSIEIADGRRSEPWTDLSTWLARSPVEQAAEAARIYWRGQNAGYEEDMRVLAVADGAFTEPGTEQQAVLFVMSIWPRCCPKTGLAVVEGERLVRNVAFEGIAQTLTRVPDLDGDGLDELAFTGSFGMGGDESGSVTLVAFGTDGLIERGSTSLYTSSCASGRSDTPSTAARVVARSGPEFWVERYAMSGCDEAATWEPAGDPELLSLDPAYSTYVELPVR